MLIPNFRGTTSSEQSFLFKFGLRMVVVKIFKVNTKTLFFGLVIHSLVSLIRTTYRFIIFFARCTVHYNSTTVNTLSWPCGVSSVQDSISCSYTLIIFLHSFKVSAIVVSIFHLCSSANHNPQDLEESA